MVEVPTLAQMNSQPSCRPRVGHTDGQAGSPLLYSRATDNLNFTVDWEIVPLNESTLSYTYTFSGFGQDLSFLVFQLTPNCTTGGECAFDVIGAGGQQEVMVHTNDMPSGESIYGIKLEGLGGGQEGSLTVSFSSVRVPMYVNFLAKSGGGTAYNLGLTDPGSGIFLPVPNEFNFGGEDVPPPGEEPIPEPATTLLFASGAALVMIARRRRATRS